jgi:hypothetical protein
MMTIVDAQIIIINVCLDSIMPLYLLGRLLEYVLRDVISNVIKGFGFPHWTPIGFQMRWSRV